MGIRESLAGYRGQEAIRDRKSMSHNKHQPSPGFGLAGRFSPTGEETYFVSEFDLCKSVAKKSKNGLARIVNSC
jgi:hypothetical protein